MRPRSLEKKATRRLTFLVTVPLLLLAACVTIFFYSSNQNQAKINSEEKTLLIASLLNREVGLVLDRLETLTKTINDSSNTSGAHSQDLSVFIANNHHITDLKIVDDTGKIILTTLEEKQHLGTTILTPDILNNALNKHKTIWLSTVTPEQYTASQVLLALPLKRGVIVATVDFSPLLRQTINFSTNSPVTVFIYNSSGSLISESQQLSSAAADTRSHTRELRNQLSAQHLEAKTIAIDNDFLTGALIKTTDWLVILQQPKTIFWDKTKPLFAILGLFFLCYIVIAKILFAKVANRFFDYFQRLIDRIHDVANGKYEQDFPTEGYIELQNVKVDMYRMTQKIKEREEVILNLNSELEEKLNDALKANLRIQHAEKDKDSQNQLLTTLLNNLQVGVIMVEMKTGKLLLSNNKAEELVGKPINLLHSRESFVQNYQIYKADTNTPYPMEELPIIRGLQGEYSYINDAMIIKPNGSKSYLEVIGCPVVNRKGKTFASLISFADISERKLAEDRLNMNHQRFLKILDGIDSTIYVADMQTHKILFMNKYMKELFGVDLTGDKCHRVLKKSETPCENCTNRFLIDENNKATDGYFWEGQHPLTGRHNIYKERAIQWPDDRLVRIQVATDITQIREMEEQQKEYEIRIQQAQKMEAIGTLAGGIAHDFNNILSPLIGYTEIIREDLPADSHLLNYTNQILKAALRSRDLVQQILAFSRQSNEEKKLVEIQPIVSEALKLMHASIPSTIEIKNQLDAKHCVVNADPTKIHQIVMNLATNAYHAMEQTGGTLTVQLKPVQYEKSDNTPFNLEPGEYLRLSIEDTGVGISDEIQQKIFDPYFTTKDPKRGTGLGLSVVQGIVEGYSGSIELQSVVGEGTQITVHLPSIAKTAQNEKMNEQESAPTGTEHILLVDDEPAVAEMETRMLERLGYRITTFTDSLKALKAFKESPENYNLIITDMNMPNMDGAQLIKNIKQLNDDIPIIVCTGFSDNIEQHQQNSLKIDCYLMKPVLRNVMAEAIRDVFTQKQRL